MRINLRGTTVWCRPFHCTPALRISSVHQAPRGLPDIDTFRNKAFIPENPYFFLSDSSSNNLSAASKWFTKTQTEHGAPNSAALSSYLNNFADWPFPYELVSTASDEEPPVVAFRDWLLRSSDIADHILAGILQPAIGELNSRTFFQLYAPLTLLKKALEFNQEQNTHQLAPVTLYIAQSSLSDLPQALEDDLPTPQLVQQAGKGDVYNSSVWLGTEPTYTPLHRDPNPNLFCQLFSRKVVRLLPPAVGDRVFFEVQVRIRKQSHSRIRTAEMMEGEEREAIHEVIWAANEVVSKDLQEAELGPGDALFIPKGWWHSVKSKGSQGHLNGSANWWFR